MSKWLFECESPGARPSPGRVGPHAPRRASSRNAGRPAEYPRCLSWSASSVAPVGGDHVGGRGQVGGPAEFGHHLTAGVTVLGSAGPQRKPAHAAARGRARWLGRATRCRWGRWKCGSGPRGRGRGWKHGPGPRPPPSRPVQHAALELEMPEAVAGLGRCRQAQIASVVSASSWRRRRKSSWPPPCRSVAHRVRIGQVGLVPVADVKR